MKIQSIFIFLMLVASHSLANDFESMSQKFHDPVPMWIGPVVGWTEVLDQGSFVMGLRLSWNPKTYVRVGAWATTLISDVRHIHDTTKYALDYDAFGLQVEPILFHHGQFRILAPLIMGLGVINLNAKDLEDSKSGGWFKTADAGLQLEFAATKNFHIGFGGGVRQFFGIEDYDLNDDDFKTYFFDLVFKWGEFP